MEVLGGMRIFRLIATADVPTSHTEAQMEPGVAHFEAFFAAVRRARRYVLDRFEMKAGGLWHINYS